MQRELPYSVCINLTPPSERQSQYIAIIGKTLAVDKQIDEVNVEKIIDVQQSGIQVRISANEVKLLRACVTGFFKHMRLVAETIREFKDSE